MRPTTPSRKPIRLIFVAGVVLLVSWFALRSTQAKSNAPKAEEKSWEMKMNEISQFLSELAPFIYDGSKFSDPANKKKIEGLTLKLSEIAHDIDQKEMTKGSVKAPDFDPALQVISTEFDETVTRAHKSFQSGHTDYARSLLKTSVSYCISCHTRTATPGAKPATGFNSGLASAGAAERIRFFAATRQFDLVAQEFESTFAEKKNVRVVDLESAARVALSVALRVNRDLDQGLKIASRVTQHPSAPESFKEDAKIWIKELELWKSETPNTPSTPQASLAAARELVIRGQLLQSSPSDAKGDVAYLKASSLLHEMLKKKATAAETADAHYYIGICYEALRDLGFWTLHESYYEACIRAHPRSTRAEACYSRLNASVRLGYTGTRGTELPSEVQRKLTALEKLSRAQTKPAGRQ